MALPGIERAVVVGLGATGMAATEALRERGVEVRVFHHLEGGAGRTPELEERARRLEARGIEVTIGGGDLTPLEWADVVVCSPGLPPSNFFLAAAVERGVRVWSEVELGWRLLDAPVVAVTGTNGKTTTTSLLARMFETGGRPCVAAGNIGPPLTAAVPPVGEGWTVVCEVSSFQLYFIDEFRPRVAVVLNVADDHYDWHSGYDDYLSAKARVTENQTAEDLLVVRAGDPGCLFIASRSRARIGAFALGDPREVREKVRAEVGREVTCAAGIAGGEVVVWTAEGTTPLLRLEDIRLRGSHNVENVLAACLAAAERGIEVSSLAAAVAGFEGLPHRMTLVAEVDGVRYIDDSKATNPHATLCALAGLDDVILIAGGRAKDLDLSVLSQIRDRVGGLVAMGESAGELEAVFAGLPCARAADVEEAVALAAGMVSPGGTVLLSPACSSLDQYADYAERGDRFAAAVRRL